MSGELAVYAPPLPHYLAQIGWNVLITFCIFGIVFISLVALLIIIRYVRMYRSDLFTPAYELDRGQTTWLPVFVRRCVPTFHTVKVE